MILKTFSLSSCFVACWLFHQERQCAHGELWSDFRKALFPAERPLPCALPALGAPSRPKWLDPRGRVFLLKLTPLAVRSGVEMWAYPVKATAGNCQLLLPPPTSDHLLAISYVKASITCPSLNWHPRRIASFFGMYTVLGGLFTVSEVRFT